MTTTTDRRVPTLFQLFADVGNGSLNFRVAYRAALALQRAELRRRLAHTRRSKA